MTSPDDVSLQLGQLEASVALQQCPEALEDLEVICKSKPQERGIATKEDPPASAAILASPEEDTQGLKVSSSGKEVPGSLFRLPRGGDDIKHGEVEQEAEGEKREHGQVEPLLPHLAAWGLGAMPDMKPSSSRQEQCPVEAMEEASAKSSCPRQPALGDLLSLSDLECSLCLRLFLEPVTTPCGHTFCKECLERCLDHRPSCPLCKQSLSEYLKVGKYNPTVLLEEIISTTFPSQLAERKRMHQAEMAELSNLTKNVPIFVCTMAFPGIPCPLHIFEPRYRLMIRRCQETGTKMFGMCIHEPGKRFADYGCMLEIQRVEFLADGRSLVSTVGQRRFRVLRRGHRDGYNTADIEYLEDEKVEGEELVELQHLQEATYQLAQRFCEQADAAFRQTVMQRGALPEKEEDAQASADGPAWCWWLISILPFDPSYQLRLFSTTSLKSRLSQLKHILTALLESRDFGRRHSDLNPGGRV
ncbi:LON peptidase N-terminal domain and RING finger protein 1-like [Alligator mississippiensis]|uniref:LON peptidase N-terminal domain and RING finger protein 1-like n=1 Tax=Alligator mississippiensis TaxID=8496 RepID=A0A151NL99_ALLMI|nr:LON peptidase N-terminal domain and RING finger protein 1-like [Alligator mississippiensis]